MRLLFAFMLYLVYSAAAMPSAPDERDSKCAETREKIRRIESKLRQGYTAKQGLKMEEELRSLREKRRRLCR